MTNNQSKYIVFLITFLDESHSLINNLLVFILKYVLLVSKKANEEINYISFNS